MGLTLAEALQSFPDPRDPKGRFHPLPAVLSLVVVAIHTTLAAISQFGRLHGAPLAFALGFRRGKTPCTASLSILLRRIDPDALQAALSSWLASRLGTDHPSLHIDGKSCRGSADGALPSAHLLTAYASESASVLAQLRVDAKTNEHKAALRMLGVLPPLSGTVVTADAMFTHKDFCEAVLGKGGDYVLPVDDNQPTLKADIEAAFAPEGVFSPRRAEAA